MVKKQRVQNFNLQKDNQFFDANCENGYACHIRFLLKGDFYDQVVIFDGVCWSRSCCRSKSN